MSLPIKLAAFDHVVNQLINWHNDSYQNSQQNDLSRLKLTKLLFFVTAATTNPSTIGLLSTFDSFAALPYGHVESVLQNHMDQSENFSISKECVALRVGRNEYTPSANLGPELSSQIEAAVAVLKSKNIKLIKYSAFELVDLSHQWQSWKTIFSLAKRNGKFSMLIPNEMIQSEPKIFV